MPRIYTAASCVPVLLLFCVSCSKGDEVHDNPTQDLGEEMGAVDMAPDLERMADLGDMERVDAAIDIHAEQDMSEDIGRDAGEETSGWSVPGCEGVEGRAFTISGDAGETLLPRTGTLSGTVTYTSGLVVLEDMPGVLVGAYGSTLAISRDAGCTWEDVGELVGLDYPPVVVAGVQGRAWVHAPNSAVVYRVDVGEQEASLTRTNMPEGEDVLGVGGDPESPDTVYVGTRSGQVHVSRDGGQGFTTQGMPADPNGGALAYTMAFDPTDPAHVIYGMAGAAMVSFDGGASWQKSQLSGELGARHNVFSVSIHPRSPEVVWAMAIDIAESLERPLPEHDGKHIYRSSDGGRKFSVALDQKPGEVTLVNGPVMVADPFDERVLYVLFSSCFQGYGTDLYRVTGEGSVSKVHHDVTQFGSITISPADPDTFYIGLTREDRNGPGSGCAG